MATIRAAFAEEVEIVASHVEVNHQAIQVPVKKARIARFINTDIEGWSTAVHDAARSAISSFHKPSGIREMPAVVVPTWAKIRVYIDAGGLEHIDIHKDPEATRDRGGRADKRARGDGDAALQPCFGRYSQRACRFLK